jgi:hypothetical protein
MKTIKSKFIGMAAIVVDLKNSTDLLIIRNLRTLSKIEALVISMAN